MGLYELNVHWKFEGLQILEFNNRIILYRE